MSAFWRTYAVLAPYPNRGSRVTRTTRKNPSRGNPMPTPTSDQRAQKRKRQWGAEKRTQPLPTIHERPSDAKIALGRIAIVVTILFWVAYVISTVLRQFLDTGGNFQFTMEAI